MRTILNKLHLLNGKKYDYPKPKSPTQIREEAEARFNEKLRLLVAREEEERRAAAKPRCWQVGWDESKQRSVSSSA